MLSSTFPLSLRELEHSARNTFFAGKVTLPSSTTGRLASRRRSQTALGSYLNWKRLYCLVKVKGVEIKAMNVRGVLPKKRGIDWNCKMQFRANSDGNRPGAAYEPWQDAVLATDGFSAVEHIYPDRGAA